MRATASAVFIAALLLVGGGRFAAKPSRVYACSIGDFGSPERLRTALIDSLSGSDFVVVGSVLDEQRVGKVGNSVAYESDVNVEAVLAGEEQGKSIRVGNLSYDDTYCSGGPRLRTGEKVLLALDRGFVESDGAAQDDSVWRLHHFLGKVSIGEDGAVSQYASVAVPVGEPEGLIREYGAVLGSSEAQISDAIAAVNAPLPPNAQPTTSQPAQDEDLHSSTGGSEFPWFLLGICGVVILAAAGLYVWGRQT
jgi:hypothetical protein